MFNQIKEALINTEMECGLSNINPEVLILLDEAGVIEFNKMGCPYWWEVDECTDCYIKGKNYEPFVKMFF